MTKDEMQAIQALFESSEKRMASMMDEKLAANNEEMGRIVDEKLAANNEVLVRRVNTVVENKYDEILNLLREDYSPIRAKVAEFSDYPETKSKVADHDRALQTQRTEIDELKKKAI